MRSPIPLSDLSLPRRISSEALRRDLESLKAHILAFVTAYNYGKHLKQLRWRTPFQAICQAWTRDPARFKINPHHLISGPYI